MPNVQYFVGPKIKNMGRDLINSFLNSVHVFHEQRPLIGRVKNLDGVLMDFNAGLRLKIPVGNWHVKISDHASGIIFFDNDISDEILISAEKFFVEWQIELFLNGKKVFHYIFDPTNKKIHFNFIKCGLGDYISLLAHVKTFQRIYNCQATCTIENYMRDLIKLYLPKIECVDNPPNDSYATYFVCATFHPALAAEEMRTRPMLLAGNQILGIGKADKLIFTPTKPRQIKQNYVCIAVQSSATIKDWLNPTGWDDVIKYLKNLGYRVLCIDQKSEQTDHGFTIKKPVDAEDFTGDIPLIERINLLAYADFFIGLGSGLSWLAWICNTPVILISGITSYWFEFDTPYRIYNRLTCHGCHNWTNIQWPTYENCPVYHGTQRAYECSKKISAQQVINAIDDIRSKKYTRGNYE